MTIEPSEYEVVWGDPDRGMVTHTIPEDQLEDYQDLPYKMSELKVPLIEGQYSTYDQDYQVYRTYSKFRLRQVTMDEAVALKHALIHQGWLPPFGSGGLAFAVKTYTQSTLEFDEHFDDVLNMLKGESDEAEG